MQEDLSPEFQQTLARRWEIDLDRNALSWEQIKWALQDKLSQLLSGDMERLVNIMYRMDIPEGKFHLAMSGKPEEIPAKLTELILERELQRLQTWNFYKNDQSND